MFRHLFFRRFDTPLDFVAEIKKSKRGGYRPGAGRKANPIKAAAFEAAEQSTERGVIFLNTVDPKRELPPMTRLKILEKCRWIYNNTGVGAYLIEHLAQRAVGTGIVCKARTSNPEWNRLAERAFENRACAEAWAFDAGAQVNFYGAQSLILRQVACDGDFFAQFLITESGGTRVRFIGAESVGGSYNHDSDFYDGVKVDKFGAPVTFRVTSDRMKNEFKDVPAADMMQFRHIRRSGYVRGVSWLHGAAMNLQDLSEILAYTKGAFKAGAQIGYSIVSQEATSIGLGAKKSVTCDNQEVTTDALYAGTLIPKLKPGEEIKSFKNEHPGGSFEPFMRYVMGEVARAIGLPPEALMIFVGASGTEFRGLLEVAQNFLERLQQMLVDQFCRPFWKFWIYQEIKAGRLPYPGDDWWHCEFIPPKKITVDNGRDGRLYIDLLEKGLMSFERYCNLHGLDAESEEDDIIETFQRRKAKCEAAGLNLSEVFPIQGISSPQPIPTEPTL
jgi:capsid protein